MASIVASQEFATASVVHDEVSVSGKCIIWPRCPVANVVSDEASASGKSIVWSRTASKSSCGKLATLQASVASTRANSPCESLSAEDAECDVSSSPCEGLGGVSSSGEDSEKCDGLADCHSAIAKDFGAEFGCEIGTGTAPTTAAGSPAPSISSHSQAGYSPFMATSSAGCSPLQSTSMRPIGQDASQRRPGNHFSPQHFHGGLFRAPDASQRTPPRHVLQRINHGLSPVGGDASARCVAAGSYPATVGSWGAASAAVAATRAAAASCSNSEPPAAVPEHDMHPDAAQCHATLATADGAASQQQASALAPRGLSPVIVASGAHVYQATDTVCATSDPVKCWLAGVENSVLSAEDLAQRLQAAMPETYDD